MASSGRTGKRGRSGTGTAPKSGARAPRAAGGLKKRAPSTRAPAKAAPKAASSAKTSKSAKGKARPTWAVSGAAASRRVHGGSTAPPISRRAILGGTILFAVGAAVGLTARRLEKDSLAGTLPPGSSAAPAQPAAPDTVTMADMPAPGSVTIDMPMAEGAAPDVLATPARAARVVLPNRAVFDSLTSADSAQPLPQVPSWMASLGEAPALPVHGEEPPIPGHKPPEGHVVRVASTSAVAPVTAHAAPAPRVAATPGAPVWLANAVGVPDPGRSPMVTVVIDDLGLDRHRTAQVISLPAPLTLSFMSYAGDLPAQTAAGHRAGHELMLHMPMQPGNASVNPGPGALMVGQSADEIRRRLDKALAGFSGYVGLNNHMGSRFTANRAGMEVVMDVVRRRKLLFLDSRTTGGSVAPGVAARAGVPFLERSIFLDHDPGRATVDRQLAQLEQVARKHGHAIAIGHPRDATIAGLSAWLGSAQRRGFALVPASATLRFAGHA